MFEFLGFIGFLWMIFVFCWMIVIGIHIGKIRDSVRWSNELLKQQQDWIRYMASLLEKTIKPIREEGKHEYHITPEKSERLEGAGTPVEFAVRPKHQVAKFVALVALFIAGSAFLVWIFWFDSKWPPTWPF